MRLDSFLRAPAAVAGVSLPRRRASCAFIVTVAVVMVATSMHAATARASSSTLGKGLRLVESNYLFESELDAPRLFGDALLYVEGRIPELRAEPVGDGAYVLTAGPCRLRLEAPPEASVPDLAALLEKAAAVIDECVQDRPEGLPPTESALLTGVLSGLDPYSTVFDAERKTEHTIQFRGKLAGVGARIGIREERLTLVTVYMDSPAYKAGLRDSDVVRRIDGVSTTNLPVSDAVRRIRGKVGTPVRLTVEREGVSDLETYTVIRGLVTIPSVTARRLDSGVIYSSISHFSQTTPSDFRARVSEAIGDEDAAGVIIDLRGNSGGSMLGSSAIGDLFLEDGLLITTAGRGGKTVSGLTAEINATADTPFAALPVAILTSPRTASGSELLAASLRNNDRTMLVGERTFGKGTVQKTYSLGSDTSLKITVGHFLPNGLSIPGGGLLPDIEIRRFRFDGDVVRLPLLRSGEELPFWLSTPSWLTTSQLSSATVIDLVDEHEAIDEDDAEPREPDDAEGLDDRVVDITAELLARFGSISATATLTDARDWLAELKTETDDVVRERLAGRSVDWRRPGAMAALESVLSPSLDVVIKPADGLLVGGEETELEVTATNSGSKPLYRMYGILRSEARFLNGRGLLFGYIAPGESRTWTLTVEPPLSMRTSRVDATVDFRNDAGVLAESAPVYLALESAPRPSLAYRTSVIAGDDDNTLLVRVDLQNRGPGTARDVRAFIKHPESDEEIELIDSSHTVESLAGGEEVSLELGVRLLRTPEEPLPVELVISEPSFRIFLESEIDVSGVAEATAAATQAWQLPPDIRIRSVLADDADELQLVAEVTDDSGLASLWSLIEGKQVGYIDARARAPRQLRIGLPWDPSDGVARVEIIATDADGLTTRYVSDL